MSEDQKADGVQLEMTPPAGEPAEPVEAGIPAEKPGEWQQEPKKGLHRSGVHRTYLTDHAIQALSYLAQRRRNGEHMAKIAPKAAELFPSFAGLTIGQLRDLVKEWVKLQGGPPLPREDGWVLRDRKGATRKKPVVAPRAQEPGPTTVPFGCGTDQGDPEGDRTVVQEVAVLGIDALPIKPSGVRAPGVLEQAGVELLAQEEAEQTRARLAKAASKAWVAACLYAQHPNELVRMVAVGILNGRGPDGLPVTDSQIVVWEMGLRFGRM